MKKLTLGNHTMIIVGTIQGLVEEKKKVADAFKDIRPEVVALPISEEMLQGLEAVVKGEVSEVETDSVEDMFADHLKRFGEVQLPPPSLIEAYNLAKENGAEVVGIDMDEEEYVRAYIKHVSAFHFWRRIWNLSKLKKKTFAVDTPEEFVVMWDRYVSRLKGYARLEEAREKFMAERSLELLKSRSRVLVLVEYERMEGIVAEIQKLNEAREEKEEIGNI